MLRRSIPLFFLIQILGFFLTTQGFLVTYFSTAKGMHQNRTLLRRTSRVYFLRSFRAHCFFNQQNSSPISNYRTFQSTLLKARLSFSPELSPTLQKPPSLLSSEMKDENHSSYEQWVRRLYMTNLFHPVKLGLENIEKLHQLLGYPMDSPNVAVIHIAGTNGKGSVALKIAKSLQYSYPEKKVGLFCSPHVSSFRERMQVNGDLISEEEVVSLMPELYHLCEVHDIPATFFEITTALAFAFFKSRQADFVVLETGLGGRLDATNVVKNPEIAVITSIGLEHTRILGDTIEKIAREKAGIMKQGKPVLIGMNCPVEVMKQCATEKQTGSFFTADDIIPVSPEDRKEELEDYDIENARIARAALTVLKDSNPGHFSGISTEAIIRGTSERPSCRFEEIVLKDGQVVVLDVAHNPPAMDYLVKKLQRRYPSRDIRCVVGMSSDKDLSLCGESVRGLVKGDQSKIHLVEAAHPRAAKVEDIVSSAGLDGARFSLEDPSVTKQMEEALSIATRNNELLVVCGSVFLMAEARENLGINEPRDSEYIAEVAGANLKYGQENFGNSGAKK